MNSHSLRVTLAVSAISVLSALHSWSAPAPGQDVPPPPREPVVVERGPHHRVWQTFTVTANVSGGSQIRTNYLTRTNSYVELATGLHYWEDNQWKESKAEIDLFQGGAAALQGQHKVVFKPNINAQGAIELTTADGKRFSSHVVGLSYFDAKTGDSALFAGVKNSIGQLLPPNQVIYPDAFDGIKADVRYTYTIGGFEQDIILRESLPSPAEFGLDPATTRLEVWTEFLDAPQPQKRQGFLKREGDPLMRQQMAVPDVVDEYLDFGQMKMSRGAAFQLEANPQPPGIRNRIPVGKQWQRMENRDFLVEVVEFAPLESELAKLPKRAARVTPKPPANRIALAGLGTSQTPAVWLLSAKLAQNREEMLAAASRKLRKQSQQLPSNGSIQLARNEVSTGKGFVLDYTLDSSQSNFTFRGDTTYYVPGAVTLSGTTIIEGGAVVKYTNYSTLARITIAGPVICQTTPNYPAIFTAKDDNTVGESISGSSGTATNWYGMFHLTMADPSTSAFDLHDLRMMYAFSGIETFDTDGSTIRNVQFVNCAVPLSLYSASIRGRNLLFDNAALYLMHSDGTTSSMENVTMNRVNYMVHAYGTVNLNFTNCILANVTNLYDPNQYPIPTSDGSHNAFFNTPTNFGGNTISVGSSPFQSVGAGYHYLGTNSSLRNVGTTAINPDLLTDLQKRTTYPPQVLENVTSTANVTLSPVTPRDTDTPDLGYHYPAVDYAVNTYAITNGTLSVLNGTVFATFGTTGIWLQDGADFVSVGTPLNPNRFTLYSYVQEQPLAWGATGNPILINPYKYGATPSSAIIRFTEFYNCQSGHSLLTTSNGTHKISPLLVQDSSFNGGLLSFATNGTGNPSYQFRNTLFDRVTTYFRYDAAIGFTNTLFRGGVLFLDSVTSNNCVIHDCAFDATSITNSGSVLHSHNGYLNLATQLTPTNANDVVVTNFTFQTGPLGHFYQPTNSSLLHVGSQFATNAGLYHYTVTTNQVKEGTNTVSIGLHYLALDSQGNPIDTDGDGLPDYIEDRNGNGVVDTGESSHADSDSDDNGISDALEDSDYDGVSNIQEFAEGTDPYDPSSFVPRLLGRWRFNEAALAGDQGQVPLATNQLFIDPTFSGTGVRGTNWSLLKYREVETNGQANINLRNGTVKLWFKPSWSSTTSGGTGPQSWGRLIELGNYTNDYSYGLWHVAMNPDGTTLYFETQAGGAAPTYWIVPIDWHAGEWHQVAVTYTPTNTAAYIDGTEAQYSYHYNSGVSVYPNATVRAAEGLKIGSNQYGTDNATGVFDEVETYNYPLSATEILADYNAVVYGDDDGDEVPNYQDAQPLNPNISAFIITILQPASGSTF